MWAFSLFDRWGSLDDYFRSNAKSKYTIRDKDKKSRFLVIVQIAVAIVVVSRFLKQKTVYVMDRDDIIHHRSRTFK